MEKLLRYTTHDRQKISIEDWLQEKPSFLQAEAMRWYQEIEAIGPEVEMIFHDDHLLDVLKMPPSSSCKCTAPTSILDFITVPFSMMKTKSCRAQVNACDILRSNQTQARTKKPFELF